MTQVTPVTPTMLFQSICNTPEIRSVINFVTDWSRFIFTTVRTKVDLANVNSMKAIWISSHLACSGGFGIYAFSASPCCYYFSIGGAISTYSISVARHFGQLTKTPASAKDEEAIPLASVLNSENALLLAAAWLHSTSSPCVFKLYSFATFATMNLISYVLHEVVLTNTFTSSLLPVLSCAEPALLAVACCTDYLIIVVYLREYMCKETSILYAMIFCYICFKRLENSHLSRVSLYHMVDLAIKIMSFSRFPASVINIMLTLQQVVHILVPLDSSDGYPADSEKVTARTRATSLFFEPVSIINDIG